MMQKMTTILVVAIIAAFAAPSVWADANIFKAQQCNRCHTIKSQGIEKSKDPGEAVDEEEAKDDREAPDLSDVGKKHDAGWMEAFLQKKEKIKGRKHTRRFKGDPADLTKLTKWLEALKG